VDVAPPASRQNLTDPVNDAERDNPDLLRRLFAAESRPQGKPTGGRVKDRGESERLIVMIRITIESISIDNMMVRVTGQTSAWSFSARHFDDDAANRNSSRI
jgi:hypothetical protein